MAKTEFAPTPDEENKETSDPFVIELNTIEEKETFLYALRNYLITNTSVEIGYHTKAIIERNKIVRKTVTALLTDMDLEISIYDKLSMGLVDMMKEEELDAILAAPRIDGISDMEKESAKYFKKLKRKQNK
jgi:hypothetical protein